MNQETGHKKKILFIITKASWGGAQRYVYDLARSLPKDRFQPVVAYGEPGMLSEELKKLQIETIALASLQRDISPAADLGSLWEMVSCIRAQRPDIVHVNSSKAALLGALAARICKVPRIVFTVHGWPFKEHRSFITRKFYYLASLFTGRLAHAVIVLSDEDSRLGQAMKGVGKKICHIPVGIEAISYVSKEEALLALWNIVPQQNIPREAMKIVTIAELTPNKGLKYGIEALVDLRTHANEHYAYVIIGEGEQRKELEELVRIHHAQDMVFFVGFIPGAAAFLTAFDVFVLPSVKEGMPYALLEAGDSGVPVIATDVVGPDLKQRYPSMTIVRAGSGFAIADAIRKAGDVIDPLSFTPQPMSPRFPLTEMVQRTVEVYG